MGPIGEHRGAVVLQWREQSARPADDTMSYKIKGLLQTQVNLSLQVSLLGRFHVGHSLVLDKLLH